MQEFLADGRLLMGNVSALSGNSEVEFFLTAAFPDYFRIADNPRRDLLQHCEWYAGRKRVQLLQSGRVEETKELSAPSDRRAG